MNGGLGWAPLLVWTIWRAIYIQNIFYKKFEIKHALSPPPPFSIGGAQHSRKYYDSLKSNEGMWRSGVVAPYVLKLVPRWS